MTPNPLSSFISFPGYPVWVQCRSPEQAPACEAVCDEEELRGLQRQECQDVVRVRRNASAGDQVLWESECLNKSYQWQSDLDQGELYGGRN